MGFFGKDKEDEEELDEDEEELDEDEEDIYELTIECDNCGIENDFEIKKGITFKEFLIGKICDNCGCPIKK